MSITHINTKSLAKPRLFAAMGSTASVLLDNLWFSDDSCAPEDLPIGELKSRLTVHLEQVGRLNPKSQEYDKQAAFAKLYQMILMLRGA